MSNIRLIYFFLYFFPNHELKSFLCHIMEHKKPDTFIALDKPSLVLDESLVNKAQDWDISKPISEPLFTSNTAVSNMLGKLTSQWKSHPIEYKEGNKLFVIGLEDTMHKMVTKAKFKYNLILYKDCLIFTHTARYINSEKSDLSPMFNFIKKVSTDATEGPGFKQEVILNGTIGDKYPYYYPTSVELTDKEKYVMVDLLNCDKLDGLDKCSSDMEKLQWLKENTRNFKFKVQDYLYQCHYQMKDKLIIGITQDKNQVRYVIELGTDSLIKYVKVNHRDIFRKFTKKDSSLSEEFDKIYKFIGECKNANDMVNVYGYDTSNGKMEKVKRWDAMQHFKSVVNGSFKVWKDKNVVLKEIKSVEADEGEPEEGGEDVRKSYGRRGGEKRPKYDENGIPYERKSKQQGDRRERRPRIDKGDRKDGKRFDNKPRDGFRKRRHEGEGSEGSNGRFDKKRSKRED